MKKISFLLMLALFFSILANAAPVKAYESLTGLTETRYWDKANAFNGYTLFAGSGKSYLIDMEGQVVHTWNMGTNPRLLENGHLIDASKDDPSGFGGFQEMDWDGNVVWKYTESRSNYHPHHDFLRIFNPKLNAYTTLYIANKDLTNEECIAAGCDPKNAPYTGAQMDVVVEVDMSGNIVWEWSFFDHVIQDVDATKANFVGEGKTIADFPGKLNLNLPGHPVSKDWLHCNSLDYNQKLDQVVINSVMGEFYVIDHGNTFVASDSKTSIANAAGTRGDFLYRFGDPALYQQGDPPSVLANWTTSTSGTKQIGGSHNIQWVAPGLPGEGHFLVFNNSQYLFERTPQSSILEINGYLNANKEDKGSYVNPPDAGYYKLESDKDTHKTPRLVSNQVVWMYRSKSNQAFFSHIGGSAQRLPNGNTLICSDTEGHFFEVTADNTLVWEYINPVTRNGILTVMPDSLPMTNSVFRAYRYTADYAGLAGKTLTEGKTLTGRTPEYLTPSGSVSSNRTSATNPSVQSPVIQEDKTSAKLPESLLPVGLGLFAIGGLAGTGITNRKKVIFWAAILGIAVLIAVAGWIIASPSTQAGLPTISTPAAKALSPTPTGSATKQSPASGAVQKSTAIAQEEKSTPAGGAVTKDLASLSSDMCINNTSDEAQAKNCCDCLSGADAAAIKNCRDTVAKHDFSQNSGFITFDVPSKSGESGDYSLFTAAANQQDCKQMCDSSNILACGDRRFCRDACAQLPVK